MQFRKTYKGLLESLYVALLANAVLGETDNEVTTKPGRYVPELYGGYKGKYMPDDSGKYMHINRPYDGGYGDRGIKYVHDSSGRIFPVKSNGAPGILPLSPKDHLRFMIDFNYDGSGFQIIKFDWIKDGDETNKYQFYNENQLWNGSADNGDTDSYKMAEQTESDGSGSDSDSGSESDVHLDGEYNESKGYDYSFTDRKINSNSNTLQNAIREVLEYIEVNILPTL